MKSGTVLLIGRPNVGKSTFVNNLIGQKVAITSAKPQTTRFPIVALYEDERGSFRIVDTPGIFDKSKDLMSKHINKKAISSTDEQVDVVIYMIDPTRHRDFEESKVLGIVRKIAKPKLLVFNKIDQDPKFLAQYEYLRQEIPEVYKISSLEKTHMKPLLNRIFELLPESDTPHHRSETGHPLLNLDSKTFLSEMIREKIFLTTGDELPYTATVVIDEITQRKGNVIYIKARILTTNDRYKKMLIGKDGRKIKEIGSMSRKEMELAFDKKIFLDLTVETDPHWQEVLYS